MFGIIWNGIWIHFHRIWTKTSGRSRSTFYSFFFVSIDPEWSMKFIIFFVFQDSTAAGFEPLQIPYLTFKSDPCPVDIGTNFDQYWWWCCTTTPEDPYKSSLSRSEKLAGANHAILKEVWKSIFSLIFFLFFQDPLLSVRLRPPPPLLFFSFLRWRRRR